MMDGRKVAVISTCLTHVYAREIMCVCVWLSLGCEIKKNPRETGVCCAHWSEHV